VTLRSRGLHVCVQTFEEAHKAVGTKDDKISPDEWQRMCAQRPELLSALSLETLRCVAAAIEPG
jgi:hypothetical protein